MIMSDQKTYRTENRSSWIVLHQSYRKNLIRFQWSLIPAIKTFMKFYQLCEKLLIKNGIRNHLKISPESCKNLMIRLDVRRSKTMIFARFSSDQIRTCKIQNSTARSCMIIYHERYYRHQSIFRKSDECRMEMLRKLHDGLVLIRHIRRSPGSDALILSSTRAVLSYRWKNLV